MFEGGTGNFSLWKVWVNVEVESPKNVQLHCVSVSSFCRGHANLLCIVSGLGISITTGLRQSATRLTE